MQVHVAAEEKAQKREEKAQKREECEKKNEAKEEAKEQERRSEREAEEQASNEEPKWRTNYKNLLEASALAARDPDLSMLGWMQLEVASLQAYLNLQTHDWDEGIPLSRTEATAATAAFCDIMTHRSLEAKSHGVLQDWIDSEIALLWCDVCLRALCENIRGDNATIGDVFSQLDITAVTTDFCKYMTPQRFDMQFSCSDPPRYKTQRRRVQSAAPAPAE